MEDVMDVTENQYLTFKLGEEVFALNVSKVREVLDMTAITRIPRAPDYLKGVINVRGGVVPVSDLRIAFGMEQAEETINTRIMVLELDVEGEPVVLGAMADSVHEVLELSSNRIETPPRIGSKFRTEFIQGIGKHDDEFVIILDIDQVFSGEIVKSGEKGLLETVEEVKTAIAE
jgi:purine-binding chemotaxis protein CheW